MNNVSGYLVYRVLSKQERAAYTDISLAPFSNSPQAMLPTTPLINCRLNIQQREFRELFILSKNGSPLQHNPMSTITPPPPQLHTDGCFIQGPFTTACAIDKQTTVSAARSHEWCVTKYVDEGVCSTWWFVCVCLL
jgi:hypothetical protein